MALNKHHASASGSLGGMPRKKERNSNIELLRILSMVLIIAHHFVMNSGIVERFDLQHVSIKVLYLQFFGMWGKTAINIFVIISGYFLCKMRFSWQRWLKVCLEYEGYKIVIYLIFLFAGYEYISFARIRSLLFGFLYGVNSGFSSSFMFFYMFVPFYCLLIERLDKKSHAILLGLLLMYYSLFGTLFYESKIFTESVWYMILFFVAAYIRKHSSAWMDNLKISVFLLCFFVTLSMLSVFVRDYYGVKVNNAVPRFYMVSDSNKLLAFLVSLFAFLTFRNMKPRVNSFINSISVTTFGVLCIHASSDAMRTWLWNDVANVPDAYYYRMRILIVYSVAVVLLVFACCSLIDLLRIKFVEKPLFEAIYRNSSRWRADERNPVKRFLVMYNQIGTGLGE